MGSVILEYIGLLTVLVGGVAWIVHTVEHWNDR